MYIMRTMVRNDLAYVMTENKFMFIIYVHFNHILQNYLLNL